MEKETIKNVGQAYLQVQENQKAALQKKLAKTASSSEKGKAAVTLPKAPWDKKEQQEAKLDPVDKKELKGKHADRDDQDIDNDGDVDGSDKFLHKKRKAISKNVKKGDKNEVEMNPKKTKENDAMSVENTLPPVYSRILENRAAHYKKAAAASPQGEGLSPGGKKMKADLEAGAQTDDTEEKGHKDASAAGRAGPAGKARPNDNKKGDKAIINPAKDITKAG